MKAFGTDTDFFKPDNTKKEIEYFYPATFSLWKRQRDITYLGKDIYCCGTIQPDGQEEYQVVVDAGATVEVGYFPAEHIRDLYRRAQHVIIPAVHGSERTVLEAMSMNILPEIVHPDINKKANSYLIEYAGSGEKTPRNFILKRYSHQLFAKQLLKGIKQCLKK